MGPRWPGRYFCQYFLPIWKALTSTRSMMRRIYLEIRFNLALCFIRSSIFYRKPLFEQTLTLFLTLFYHIWLKTVKGTWTEGWETRRCRTGEIVFVYQNNKRNESRTLASKYSLHIWKIDGKVLENQLAFLTLNLRRWFMQTPCHFSPLLMIEFRSIRRCLAFPGQIHRCVLNGI